MTAQQIRSDDRRDGYEIRRYRSSDRESYLELYETVYSPKSVEWFDWRYSTPLLDHVPIFVASVDGTVAAAEAFLPFRLRAGGETTVAIQPADAMVHPDHRRRGLFSGVTEAALSYYADHEPTHCFNFPTSAAKPALVRLGWREVGRVPNCYRIQNPGAVLAATESRLANRATGRLSRPLLACHRLARRSLGGRHVDTDDVDRVDGVPDDVLAGLLGRHRPDGVHVGRDESFYRWRLANPNWESVQTYLASRDGEPVAAVVTATHRTLGMTITKVMDAVPRTGTDHSREFEALLDAVVSDVREHDVLVTTRGTIPSQALRRFGFCRDDRLPLSLASRPTELVVRPIDDAGWNLGGRELTDPDEWMVTFSDQDTPF